MNFVQIDSSFSLYSAIRKQPPCPNIDQAPIRWSVFEVDPGVFGLIQPENVISIFKEESNYYSNIELQSLDGLPTGYCEQLRRIESKRKDECQNYITLV